VKFVKNPDGSVTAIIEKGDKCHICGGEMLKCGCGWVEAKKFTVHGREYLWTYEEMKEELGITDDKEACKIWKSAKPLGSNVEG
jgi:hypothetical protein